MSKILFPILILICLTLGACQEMQTEELPILEGEAFELYLVSDKMMTGADLKDYELDEIPLAEKPFIKTDDIHNFLWEDQLINLKETAYKSLVFLFSDNLPLSGLPFVIVSHGERIYAGAFWSPFSSASFDGVTIIQPLDPAGMPLVITLGYPTDAFFSGEDPRYDLRLKQALENADLLWDGETEE